MADARRYNAVAMTLHWLIAALIATNICLAWYFNTLHGLSKVGPLQIHKSIGITILTLSVLRLAWRFISPPPPMPAMSSASPLIKVYPITWFGLFRWPTITALSSLSPDRMKPAHALFQGLHDNGAILAYVLIAFHVLAALRHQFIKNDEVLWRMLPTMRRPA